MKSTLNDKGKTFKIEYHNMQLNFQLFTKKFIMKELKQLENERIISSAKLIEIPVVHPFTELKSYYEREQKDKRYFFAYIKFFNFNDTEYGLVCGKTNYVYPDIDFSKTSDTVARNFLKNNAYEWSRDIIIIDCLKENLNKKESDKQVRFLECFLQRQFNLLNS